MMCGLLGVMASFLAQPVLGYAPCEKKKLYGDPAAVSYTYSRWNGGNHVLPSPAPYIADYFIDSKALGVTMTKPQDVAADSKGNFYISDSGANRIICTDSEFNVQRIMEDFSANGVKETFSNPSGCYVTEKGEVYVADTDNSRIVVLDAAGKWIRTIGTPDSDILDDDFKFHPQKVAVDNAGRIYVVAKGVFEGIMVFYEDGTFSGFIGSMPVTASPLEILWKSILTQKQKQKVEQYIPVEYTNLFLDDASFIYAVSLSTKNENPIRRLNMGGQDILIRNSLSNTPVAGDVPLDYTVSITGKSQFVDICADSSNVYYALDGKRGRIFAYDVDGNLLLEFGGLNSNQYGTFKKPTAIFMVGDNIGILDSEQAAITVFRPTDYVKYIQQGLYTYQESDYEQSIAKWQEVLKINGNFDLAYSKIGMSLYRLERYEEAMTYFEQGLDKEHFSKAFNQYRKVFLRENLGMIITIAVSIVALLVTAFLVYKRIRKRRTVQ